MSHDVFISFSSVNSDIAGKVCTALEESGSIKCWIAYRDIVPSANYAEQLVEAIESSKLLLLILSEESNKSVQVSREVERAGSKGIPILPLRIEDVTLSKAMEYFISSHHWLDAYEADIEKYFPALRTAVESSVLGKDGPSAGTDTNTRKSVHKAPSKGISPQILFAAGVMLTILVLGLALFKPHQGKTVVDNALPGPMAKNVQSTGPTISSQDDLIQELAQRYKENKTTQKTSTDEWTSSSPLSIAFLDVSGSGVNDAEIDYILNNTGEELRESKRYTVVEREMIDKLLAELNLSSSDLADPDTALKLGRILSANLIVTGSLAKQDDQWLANLRFIDTETTAIKCSVSTIVKEGGASAVVSELGKATRSKLRKEFPLQAKITSLSGQNVSMNIGDFSGVSSGMIFTILEENNPVDVATVTSVEPKKSYMTLASSTVHIKEGMRLREDIQE